MSGICFWLESQHLPQLWRRSIKWSNNGMDLSEFKIQDTIIQNTRHLGLFFYIVCAMSEVNVFYIAALAIAEHRLNRGKTKHIFEIQDGNTAIFECFVTSYSMPDVKEVVLITFTTIHPTFEDDWSNGEAIERLSPNSNMVPTGL